MKKITALFLVLSILALSENMYAEKKGANLIIQRVDRIRVRGELIAVKKDSLLLLERESVAGVTVDIGDIEVIKIVRGSRVLVGGITGLLFGGVIGFLIGYPQGDEGGFVIVSKPQAGAIGAAIGGVSCALFGAGIGAAVGEYKTIQVEGKSDVEIQRILEYLRKKARIRNSQ